MTGTLAQLIALVSYGNEYLANDAIPQNFYPDNSTFQFCGRVTYKVTTMQSSFLGLFHKKETEIIDTPQQWYKILKDQRCKSMRLYYQHSSEKAIDHKMAGFIGGGGVWLIEVLQENALSNYWVAKWLVGNKDAPDRKIWLVDYSVVAVQPTAQQVVNEKEIRIELSETLKQIAAFASKHDRGGYADVFLKAQHSLDDEKPETGFYHQDLIVTKNYPLHLRQLLFACAKAWVFGGMGSWNDCWYESEADNKLNEELSNKLYDLIAKGISCSLNS